MTNPEKWGTTVLPERDKSTITAQQQGAGSVNTLRSLGLRTELFFDRHMGQLEPKEGYTVVRTPSNPHYWYGNYLLLPKPPETGDYDRWMQWFATAFPVTPSSHRVFQWDNTDAEAGEHQEFLDAGFELSSTDVLTARTLTPPASLHQTIDIRPVDVEQEFEHLCHLWEDIHSSVKDGEVSASHSEFVRQRIRSYLPLLEAGHGQWWGAWHEGRLVADLSLFFSDELGRFQNVGTHPSVRRQGICRTLVYTTAAKALAERPDRTLVILAESDSAAGRIYRSLGFSQTETVVDLFRPPAEEMKEESFP
jgi:ribosomal protein S18 acetylase RimI-like enzyme